MAVYNFKNSSIRTGVARNTFWDQTLTVDILVIAGGGGGNTGSYGTGGGAGGLLSFMSQSLPKAAYPCTIGAGGTASATPTNGGDSQFGALTLVKGGGFGGKDGVTGATGGSGGGGARNLAGGAATSGQGNAGGTGAAGGTGGGGGAGTAGGNSGASPGSAGEGTGSFDTWASATSTGILYSGTRYYAGGGAGLFAGPVYGTAINGGTAGGANGPANTGSAGGAAPYAGGVGGSGIVIVRYLSATAKATGGTIVSSGGYQYHTFTSSGNFVIS